MSEEKEAPKDYTKEMQQIESICKSASDLCAFTMFHMESGEFGLAVSHDEVAVGFFNRLKELYKNLSGDKDADGKFELEYIDYDDEHDGESGSAQADQREESGVIRPRDRKLH